MGILATNYLNHRSYVERERVSKIHSSLINTLNKSRSKWDVMSAYLTALRDLETVVKETVIPLLTPEDLGHMHWPELYPKCPHVYREFRWIVSIPEAQEALAAYEAGKLDQSRMGGSGAQIDDGYRNLRDEIAAIKRIQMEKCRGNSECQKAIDAAREKAFRDKGF